MANIKYNIGVFRVSQFNPYRYVFRTSSYQNILINLDLILKNDNGYFCYLDEMHGWNVV